MQTVEVAIRRKRSPVRTRFGWATLPRHRVLLPNLKIMVEMIVTKEIPPSSLGNIDKS